MQDCAEWCAGRDCLGRYPLSWPSAVSSVLDTLGGGAFSVAGDVVSFRCLMDPSDGSRYLRGSAMILASPLIACTMAVAIWMAAAGCRRPSLGSAPGQLYCDGDGAALHGPSIAEPGNVSFVLMP